MECSQIEKTVLAVLTTVLKSPFEVGGEVTRQNTPSWDSLKHIELMFALEEELGVEFTEQELVQLDSVSKIINIVQIHHAA